MAATDTKVLLFDVFGTCVDWRSTVTKGLADASQRALSDSSRSVTERVREQAEAADWGRFAQDWRNTYKVFTKALASDPKTQWKSVDDHHFDALNDLIKQYGIESLWTAEEIRTLRYTASKFDPGPADPHSLIWHRLDPWQDSVQGMQLLNQRFQTGTLSNGNVSLLEDLKSHSKIPFTHIISAEMFNSYKPSPAVYLGAAERIGVAPHECGLVAAHLTDLLAAKAAGYGTAIYVNRPREEDFGLEQVEKVRNDGSIDVWVDGEEGFVTVAKRLGIVTNA